MLTAEAQASLDRVLKSGEYVKRPHRQIFVEHTFTNAQGQVVRQVTREDLIQIANTGNAKAVQTGDLAPIGLGHTLEPVRDEAGNVVKRFAESEQPRPIGYLHNYSVEQLPSGKWALFADEWIQKVIPNERGEPVDGVQYAGTYPRRSVEYFPQKKFIDWLALLRITPALDMGLDLYQYASLFPDKVAYSLGSDGAKLFSAVEDSLGKWRYAAMGDDMDDEKPDDAPDSPPDDRAEPSAPPSAAPPAPPAPAAAPPIPAAAAPAPGSPPTPGGLPDLHKTAAEQYALHCLGMHHSHAAALLHHAHAMYGAQLGLNPDKHTPHVHTLPAGAAPPNPAAAIAAAGAPPVQNAAACAPAPPVHQQNSPVGLKGDSSWQHGSTPDGAKPPHQQHDAAGPSVPGGGNAYIPGTEEERRRMSAVQQGVQSHQYTSELQAERYAREQLAKEVADLKLQARKATYERDLTGLLGQGYQLNLVKEMERGEKWAYAADRCAEQLQCIRENYARPTDGDTSPVLLYSHEGSDVVKLPSRQAPADPEGVGYKTMREAQKYAAKHGCTFEQAIEKLKTA